MLSGTIDLISFEGRFIGTHRQYNRIDVKEV
jgi:hypothetical protein